ncbi:MAG: hypothetical protein Q4B43_06940 [Bacteroidota bacterium]|nr:hypothetical protein [Bacteroidota bacterium]
MLKNISFVLCMMSFFAFAQPKLELVEQKQIQEQDYLGEDIFGAIYYTSASKIYKKLKDGKILYYDNIQLGEISYIDYINPLKVMLFYKDFNAVVILDNMFTEVYRIDLSKYMIRAEYCSMASDNKFWIFDNNSNRMMLLDYVNERIFNLNTPKNFRPNFIQSDLNNWYFVDDRHQICSYNIYGNIMFLTSIEKYDLIFIGQNNQIIFSLEDNLYLYTEQNNNPIRLLGVDNKLKRMWLSNKELRLLIDDTIKVYTINK